MRYIYSPKSSCRLSKIYLNLCLVDSIFMLKFYKALFQFVIAITKINFKSFNPHISSKFLSKMITELSKKEFSLKI
jgi:hypothetical protein